MDPFDAGYEEEYITDLLQVRATFLKEKCDVLISITDMSALEMMRLINGRSRTKDLEPFRLKDLGLPPTKQHRDSLGYLTKRDFIVSISL
jgi:hypothetical protein